MDEVHGRLFAVIPEAFAKTKHDFDNVPDFEFVERTRLFFERRIEPNRSILPARRFPHTDWNRDDRCRCPDRLLLRVASADDLDFTRAPGDLLDGRLQPQLAALRIETGTKPFRERVVAVEDSELR